MHYCVFRMGFGLGGNKTSVDLTASGDFGGF